MGMKDINIFGLQDNMILDILLNEMEEAIVVVDNKANIIKLSSAYAEFLGVDADAVVGKPCVEVIDNSRMHIVLETKKPEIAQIQDIKGNKMIANRIPIIRNGKVLGAVGRVLFKSTDELVDLYNQLDDIKKELAFYEGRFQQLNKASFTVDDIIGKSPEIMAIKDTIEKVSRSKSNILIHGESGTGKEIVAQSIHNCRHASEKSPFVSVNCAAIPADLIEAELFGYEEGAFTGAKKGGKIGLFQAAKGGTLFLDEIGEMPLQLQVKLLRVLQERTVRRVGSRTLEPIDISVIAATNRNLEKMISEKTFREDLYFRLNVISITTPPLREHLDDIPELADYILRKMSGKSNILIKGVSRDAMRLLKMYSYPGNVRELENILERSANYADSGKNIETWHLPTSVTGKPRHADVRPLAESMDISEKAYLTAALNASKGKKTLAAQKLGISRTTLYEKLTKHNIVM